MRFVPDWRKAYRWISVQALAVIAVLPFAWEYIPIDVRNMIPLEWQPFVFSAFAVGGILGRLVKQS